MLKIAARDDDVDAARERFSQARQNALERLSAHDAGFSHRDFLEMFEVFGDVPRHGVVFTDHIVIGGGNDEGDHWFHKTLVTSGTAAIKPDWKVIGAR